jgi:hypothetical protein
VADSVGGVGIDVSLLTSILSPCLGFLLAGTNAAAQQIGTAVGADVVSLAQKLWAKLKSHVEAKPAALEAIRDVAKNPDDEQARNALEWQLKKILDGLPGLAAEVSELLKDPAASRAAAIGDRSVAVAGDVSGVIVTGDGGSVQR